MAECVLEQDGGREGVDVALAVAGRAAHFVHGPERGGGGESLVEQSHGQSGALLEFGRDVPHLDGARRVVALAVQRQAEHERPRFQRVGAPHEFGNGRAFAGAPLDVSGG